MGTHELVVFDPLLAGPKSLGGPVPLQLWRREAGGGFARLHFGKEPVYSEVLDAWVIAEDRNLVIADDRGGKKRWQNEAQMNRADALQARAEAERTKVEAERLRAETERLKVLAERATKLEQELAALRAKRS
jgi:hypothetical protein